VNVLATTRETGWSGGWVIATGTLLAIFCFFVGRVVQSPEQPRAYAWLGTWIWGTVFVAMSALVAGYGVWLLATGHTLG
jgi:hypothetical protein